MALGLELTDIFFLWALSNQLFYITSTHPFFIRFLVILCLAVAAKPCMELNPIKKGSNLLKKPLIKNFTFLCSALQ